MDNNIKSFGQIVEDMGKRKTYFVGGNIDVYTTRGANRTKVFRVKWQTLNYPTPQEFSKANRKALAKGRHAWPTSEHSINFEFSEAGYEEAKKYAKTITHYNDAVRAFREEEHRIYLANHSK